jgi:aminopeptidase
MKKNRTEKLAQVLVERCLQLKPRDVLCIQGDAIAAPLIEACYRTALRRGAFVITDIGLGALTEIFYEEAGTEQLRWLSPLAKHTIREVDALLRIACTANTRSLTNADPRRVATVSAAQKPLYRIKVDRAASHALHWVLTQWPCNANAQEADMSLREYEDFVFQAGCIDDPDPMKTWRRVSKAQQALADFLNTARDVRIVAEDTDLRFNLKDRTWLNSDGRRNFPDGEVFTGPVEESVEGQIKFSFPAVYGGREVNGVRLTFNRGKVVKGEAERGQDFLSAMLAADRGASYVGEAALGTNYRITRFTRNTLFDEKIGGTMHLALGAGFPDTGNRNRSGLHWDMVCDLRRGGEIYADGELIQKNGRFLNRKFPQP